MFGTIHYRQCQSSSSFPLRTEGVSRGVKVHPGYIVAGFGWASYPTFTQYSYRSVLYSTVNQYTNSSVLLCTCSLWKFSVLLFTFLCFPVLLYIFCSFCTILHLSVPLCACLFFSVFLFNPLYLSVLVCTSLYYYSVLLCTSCSGLMRCCCSCGIEPAITICQVSWIRFLRRNLYRYLQISITTIYIYLFCQGEGDGMMKTLEEINVEQ